MTTRDFDKPEIRRSALALQKYLLALEPSEDLYGMRTQVLPIVEQALTQALQLPFDLRKKPLSYEAADGSLPAEYIRLAAPFFVAISGMSGLGNDLLKSINREGKQFVWMEFEEPETDQG